VEDFIAWRLTISSLIRDDSGDENRLAKIIAVEFAGLAIFAGLIASIKSGENYGRLSVAA
jgi:hypothetical protein